MPEKRLSVYSTVANYSLPIVQRQGREYVGLLELLEPLGTVSAKSEGPRWRLHYNNILGDFTVGKNRARVQGRDTDLSAQIPYGKWTRPGSAGLAEFSSPLVFLEARRICTRSPGVSSSATSDPLYGRRLPTPSHLVFQFSAPVNPSIATEPGKLRMTFSHEAVTAPASPTLTFSSKTIPSATYSESNGAAEITVTTTIPLIARFSQDGRTITLAAGEIADSDNCGPQLRPACATEHSAGTDTADNSVFDSTSLLRRRRR